MCSLSDYLVTDVSGRPIVLIFKVVEVQEECGEQIDTIGYRGWCGQ
jgi:hypothetical protein